MNYRYENVIFKSISFVLTKSKNLFKNQDFRRNSGVKYLYEVIGPRQYRTILTNLLVSQNHLFKGHFYHFHYNHRHVICCILVGRFTYVDND